MKYYTLSLREKCTPAACCGFYHGFTSSKLVYSYFAVALAQAGFRVVMPDAPDHGARFTGDEQVRLGQFWQILHGSLTEFAGLRDALYRAGWWRINGWRWRRIDGE